MQDDKLNQEVYEDQSTQLDFLEKSCKFKLEQESFTLYEEALKEILTLLD